MKALFSTSRNIRYVIVDGKVEADIEAIFGMHEKQVQFVGLEVVSVPTCETVRFVMDVQGTRRLAERLHEWANEAEAQAEKFTIDIH